jgi:hypothetical protein
VRLLPLVAWEPTTDTFLQPTVPALVELAGFLGVTSEELETAVQRRTQRMETLASGRGVGISAMREAVDDLMEAERTSMEAADSRARAGGAGGTGGAGGVTDEGPEA